MASGSGPYSPEFRAEVVAAYMAGGKTYAQIAREFGRVSAETVRNWVTAEKKARSGRTEEARAATQRAREREPGLAAFSDGETVRSGHEVMAVGVSPG